MLFSRFDMRPRLTLTLALECPVCKRYRDEDLAKDTAVLTALYGAKAYAICPCCGQEALYPADRQYRARADRYVNRRCTFEQARTVECPWCFAKPGDNCTRLDGKPASTLHNERLRAYKATQPNLCRRAGGRWHPGEHCTLPCGHTGPHSWKEQA